MRKKLFILMVVFYFLILLLVVRDLYSFIFVTAVLGFFLLVLFSPDILKKTFFSVKNRLLVSYFLQGIVPVVLLLILSMMLIYVMFTGFSSTLLLGWLDYKIAELENGEGLPFNLPLKDGFEGLVIDGDKVFIAVKKENVRISRIDLVLPEFFREEYGLEVYIPPYIYYREKEALKVKRLRKIPDAPGFRFPVVFSSDVYSVSDNRYYEGSVFFLRGTLGALISGIIKGKNTISNSVFLSFLFFAIILSFLNLIAMFGGYLIVRDISKGMSRLSFAINAVKRGDLTVRLNPNRVDELGEMMRNFDLMVERMRLLLEKEKEIDIMEQEIKIARKIQLRLMPPEKVEIPGIEHSALTIAARGVGGDFYDIIKGEDWVVVMADVSGKGLHSSLFGAMLKGILTALIKMGLSLKHAVEMSNKLLYHHLYPTHFITLAAIRIKEDEIEVVRAGHQPVLVYKPFSESELERMLVLKPEGIGLGMVEDLSPYIESEKIKIEKGDLFVLFTDGLSELPSKDKRELFGLDRIVSIIKKYYNRPSSEILSRIIKMAESFSGEELPPDDIALFIGKVK